MSGRDTSEQKYNVTTLSGLRMKDGLHALTSEIWEFLRLAAVSRLSRRAVLSTPAMPAFAAISGCFASLAACAAIFGAVESETVAPLQPSARLLPDDVGTARGKLCCTCCCCCC